MRLTTTFFTMLTLCTGPLSADNPSEKPADAPAVDISQPFTGAITHKGMNNWFKVTIDKPGYLTLTSKNVPEPFKLQYRMASYDPFKGTKELGDWAFLNEPVAVSAGTLLLQLQDDWNDAAHPDSFSLSLTFTAQMDPGEPNNNWKTATVVTCGGSSKLAVCPKKDTDWYKISVPGPGFLVIEHQADGMPDIELMHKVYAAASIDEIKELGGGRTKEENAVYLPAAGDYYVELYDQWNDQQSLTSFLVRFSLMDCLDAAEPNNKAENAAFLALPSRTEMSIFPTGDVDFYKLRLPEDGKLTLKLPESMSDVDVRVTLYEQQSGTLKKLDKREFPTVFALKGNSEYYLQFSDEWNDDADKALFTVVAEAVGNNGTQIAVAEQAAPTAQTTEIRLVTIPNVVGQKGTKARQALETLGLQAEVYGDPDREVLKLIPSPGTSVEENTKVAIGCKRKQIMVRVPKVVGLPTERAVQMLSRRHLRPQQGKGNGTVTAQTPAPGTQAPLNTAVSLSFSPPSKTEAPTRSLDLVTVPDVKGKSARAARYEVQNLGLQVSIQSTNTTMTPQQALQSPALQGIPDFDIKLPASLAAEANKSRGGRSCTIVSSQQPSAGLKVDKGHTVILKTITVQSAPNTPPQAIHVKQPENPEPPKPQHPMVKLPSVMGKQRIAAKNTLQRMGFRVKLEGKMIGRVIRQHPRGNTEVRHGETVTLTIGR